MTASHIPPFFGLDVSHDAMRLCFYDIESLSNAFTLSAWQPKGPGGTPHLTVWYLVDAMWDAAGAFDGSGLVADLTPYHGMIVERIRRANPMLVRWDLPDEAIELVDLHTPAGLDSLGAMFGVTDALDPFDPASPSAFPDVMRPVMDLSPDFDPVGEHPYLIGFNSRSYDLTMLAIFFWESVNTVAALSGAETGPVTLKAPDAQVMRRHNDILFAAFDDYMPRYLTTKAGRHTSGLVPEEYDRPWQFQVNRIYRNFMASGRHIDAMPLNEHNKHAALKRLLGMMGWQILESDRLDAGASTLIDMDGLADLIAYNVSDVVGLGALFERNAYATQFDLKLGLMRTYPQTTLTRDGLTLVEASRPDANERESEEQ